MTQQQQPRSFWIGPDGPPRYIWASDRLVPWDEATVHASMLGWSSISMVFEGIRGYWNPSAEQLNVFHLVAHMRRLLDSMKIMRMTSRWTVDELVQATADVLAANEFKSDVYIQPIAYFDGGIPGYSPVIDQPGEVMIFSRPIITFLESERALNCGFVTWQRLSDNVMPPRAKAVSNYQNARYMSNEARLHGYDYALSFNQEGKVSELSHACIFVVRDGVAATPPVTAGVLESITVKLVCELLEGMGIEVSARDIDRTELYVADEVFLAGTGLEIQAIGRVDGYSVGDGEKGAITTQLCRMYNDIVRGADPRYADLLTPVG